MGTFSVLPAIAEQEQKHFAIGRSDSKQVVQIDWTCGTAEPEQRLDWRHSDSLRQISED